MDLSPDEDNFQGRLLHQAALWDNVELVVELLSSGAAVDARDSCQRSALHAAALAERSRCLGALCAAGAALDAVSDTATGGKTALHIAAERGHVENVKTLLAAGASLGVADARGDTPLALAERNSHRHAAHALREARDALERERLSQHAALRELISRGDCAQLRQKLTALGSAAGLINNLTPGGANTLLYVASEAGLTAAVSSLLEAGADGRAHPVTKYCPLYIACYHGHVEIAKLLLAAFPEAVQQETVEKWLPLHAACIGGHAALVTLLLEHPYPESVLTTYTDPSGEWQYMCAFDVNARDVSGQTALYVACTLGNLAVVDALLSHRVKASPAPASATAAASPANSHQTESRVQEEEVETVSQVLSPQRSGISLGIHAIVNKLTGSGGNQDGWKEGKQICPVSVEAGRAGDSCVSCAVRGGHIALLRRLLAAGADPNASAAPPNDLVQSSEGNRDRRRSRSASAALGGPRGPGAPSPARPGYNTDRETPWTALALAARARNVQLAEVLLQHGATDPHGRAAAECARHQLTDLLAKILATKAYPDPDYKLNKSTISESVFNERDGDSTLTYNALCPTTPVMVNWRELRAHIAQIRMSWVRLAALRVNSRLARSGTGQALHAITRLDISNNELRLLPPELFSMLSIRYLNAAQNKLERLPHGDDPFEEDLEGKKKRKKKSRPELYSAPVLQEVYLQDNRLEEIPGGVFRLPSLTTLDVSNNKLRALSSALWRAPALRDLNVALNHLRDLPTGLEGSECTSPMQAASPCELCPQLGISPSAPSVLNTSNNANMSKSSSRSPSIERSESEHLDYDDDAVPTLGNRAGNAVWSEARRAHTWRGVVEGAAPPPSPSVAGWMGLAALNLAHNQFTCVPPALACRAPNLTRLNMAYNSLRSMSYVTSYPTSLRQLDLSHNEITCWPSLPQVLYNVKARLSQTLFKEASNRSFSFRLFEVENFGSSEGDPLACYCPSAPNGTGRPRPRSGGSVRSQLLNSTCPARRHLRLEGLRTLILANNLLTRIQLTTDDDGYVSAAHDESTTDDDDEWNSGSALKGRLLFPLLSMLDVSCNLLRAVPPAIHELTNLSVLNISGNKDITDLPPQMGLLSRLWNLNTVGCTLQEPLRSMLACGRYKSMDIVGYLKSVLQEARPYARMKLMLVGLQGIGKTSLLECLRQESAIQHRRKPTEHWAKRMGNKSSRRGNLSTVGVDIGTWIYEKHRATRGPVTFRTWDFGGQHEYYATHQYFLSRRSLYLVMWKVTDGRRGLAGALDWLRSIQARAPGSPVIMVATHYDQVASCNLPENESPECLQRLIRSSIMGAPDADKLGLPKVLDSVEVSCSTRHNIRLLADIIYSVAFSVKPPGSKEPLLEQRIPATYLALEECVTSLAAELREPVLKHEEYKRLVTQYMQQKNHRMFRDAAELHQATMFLHENGVLLHYDDATLKELYFLKPQWLCDVLAHVVTVREINPFANNGVMKIDDLAHVFKASPLLARGDEAWSLGVSLLNKFELALCWDARLLLVPPLLPKEEPVTAQLPVRSRSWSSSTRGTPRRTWPGVLATAPDRGTDSPTLIQDATPMVTVHGRCVGRPLRRLLLLSYVPCGFWARLCARLLADSQLADCAAPHTLYRLPPELETEESLSKALELSWGWKLWDRGVKVCCGQLQLLQLRHLPPRRDALLPGVEDEEIEHPYQNVRFRVRQEGAWCELDVQSSACIEILLPAHVCVLRRDDGLPIAGYQSISLEPTPETLAKVLALVSDHVDLLLEDWYPALGTRFVHTSEGRCLITRIVPCPECLRSTTPPPAPLGPVALAPQPDHEHMAQAFRRLELGAVEPRRLRLSEESRTSDGDSGVGAESNASSRLGSVEGVAGGDPGPPRLVGAAWTVEQCILCACTSRRLVCARHDEVELRHVAPDTLLLDIEESMHARWEHITRVAVAGRGAFGTVLSARWGRPSARGEVPIALKALQPVPPPPTSDAATHHAYKAALSRWEREPTSSACRAYCGLRQELHILLPLQHPHVVPLLAVCAAPLALLLGFAPKGALDVVLRSYRDCGARCGPRLARALALQVARALEYLHARRVVYRDLKSENVLVWQMPASHEAAAVELSAAPLQCHVKLGDYGISRLAPPSGTKGFGGTEGFMAPEIMRYNGEEEYNEKVDCFSYGMLLYEIVTGRQPFEGHEAVKEAVLEGARPSLSPRDLEYPCCMLETMRRCWAGAPALRPSAAALVSVAGAPEYTALCDAAAARPAAAAATTILGTPSQEEDVFVGWEVWYGGGEPERAHTLLATTSAFTHHHTVRVPPDKAEPVLVTAMCRVGNKMWLGDSAGRISVYSCSTCALVWSVRVQEVVGATPMGAGVSALLPLQLLHRVAVALTCGRLFLVTSHRPEAEGSFVLTELGTATELCCLTAVPAPHGWEVWAGGDGLYSYSVNSSGVCGADTMEAAPKVTLLAATDNEPYVAVYSDPGTCVTQWSVRSRRQVARLDCSKLVPCSESLQSIALDDHLTDDKCRVTALCALRSEVYIGTAWGCIIVADASSLRPLTVFRPYEEDVRVILPLQPHKEGECGMLVTFGHGYRPLLQRYAPHTSNTTNTYAGFYCLLWRAQHWLPD